MLIRLRKLFYSCHGDKKCTLRVETSDKSEEATTWFLGTYHVVVCLCRIEWEIMESATWLTTYIVWRTIVNPIVRLYHPLGEFCSSASGTFKSCLPDSIYYLGGERQSLISKGWIRIEVRLSQKLAPTILWVN